MANFKIKIKSKKTKKKLQKLKELEQLPSRVIAGHPPSLATSRAPDKLGVTPLEKAEYINITGTNTKPYLKISYDKNKTKYQKLFIKAYRKPPKKQIIFLNHIGKEMVKDIKAQIRALQVSKISQNTANLHNSVGYIINDNQ